MDTGTTNVVMGLSGLVERELRGGDDRPSTYEVIAGLTLAVRVIERQAGDLLAARARTPEVPAPAEPVKGKGEHRHKFIDVGQPDGSVRQYCGVCNEPKKANGRPKKEAEAPAAPRGEVRDLEDVIS